VRTTSTRTSTSWADFERAAPKLAARGRECIERFRFVFLGTVRKDGGPRVNPVEAQFVRGELTHAVLPDSVKGLDLVRDPRAYIHSPILEPALGKPGEFKLRGRAMRVDDTTLREAIREAIEHSSGWKPPTNWLFFRIEVEGAAFHVYDESTDTHVMETWTPERGYEATTRTITT
jgi:hypothetical protein